MRRGIIDCLGQTNGLVDFGVRIVTAQELIPLLTRQREQDARVALANGGFDLLHVGHIRYLQMARALGGRVGRGCQQLSCRGTLRLS